VNHVEAEKWVIGGLLINPENIDRVKGKLSVEDFSDPTLSKTFATLEEIHHREDVPLERLTIYTILKESLKPDEFEIVQYVGDDIPTDATLEYWTKVVRKQSLERTLREYTDEEDPDPVKIEAVTRELVNLGKNEILYRPIKEVPPISKNRESEIKTGLIDLDRNQKFSPGDVIVIAGRTGEGKTALGTGILYKMSKERMVGMISLEMTAEEVRTRLESSFGDLPDNFFIADPYALTTLDLKTICKAMREEQGVDVILIDYLQLMREREDFRSRHLEVSHIIRRIKEIAKELKIAFIVICQLSRSIDYRGKGSLPSLSDLKESGDVEYAADVVLFIHAPDQEDDEDFVNENVKLLIIAKNRWGPKGKIKIYWDGPRTRFGNYQKGDPNELLS